MELTIFRYSRGSGVPYRIPAWIKLLSLCPATWLIFRLEIPYCAAAIAVTALVLRLSGFPFREQAADVRPILFYLYFMYAVSVFTNIAETAPAHVSAAVLIPRRDTALLLLRLLLTMQVSSLLFKTTTSVQLQDGLSLIETTIRSVLRAIPVIGRRVPPDPAFAGLIALFITFIPRVFASWNKIERAWKARGGKNGIAKMKTLLPVLFSVCMTEAEKSFFAAKNRSAPEA